MSAPQSLFQAAVNRLAARVGSGLADTAATLTLLAQDAPARLQQEFSLFWEEVEQEAARLDRQGNPVTTAPEGSSPSTTGSWGGFAGGTAPVGGPAQADPQDTIDALRAQVARLAHRLDGGGAPAASSQGPGPKV